MRTLNEVIKAIEICKNPDINRNCKDCPMPDTQECMGVLMTDALHYLETWKLIVESERKAHKADVPANSPLTWDELRQMLGKPVWVEALLYKQWAIIAYVSDEYIRFEGASLYAPECRTYMGEDNGWQAYRKERTE